MEKRLLLVFALTFLVILLFQPLLKKYLPQPASPSPKTQEQRTPAQPTAQTGTVAASASMAPAPRAPSPVPTVSKQASAEAETVIENDLYRITFTNRGGQVKSWILKKFRG